MEVGDDEMIDGHCDIDSFDKNTKVKALRTFFSYLWHDVLDVIFSRPKSSKLQSIQERDQRSGRHVSRRHS